MEQGRYFVFYRRCKLHRHWQHGAIDQRALQGIGQSIKACFEINDLGRLQQSQVAFGQGGCRIVLQCAVLGHAWRQAVSQQLAVIGAADLVGKDTGERQA